MTNCPYTGQAGFFGLRNHVSTYIYNQKHTDGHRGFCIQAENGQVLQSRIVNFNAGIRQK